MNSQTKPEVVIQRPESLLGKPCLIAGSDIVRVQECADALRTAARGAGYDQVERIDAADKKFDWDELKAVCVSPGLFASKRVIDLRLAQAKLPVAGAKVLIEVLEAADPDLQWIVSLTEWSRKAERESWIKPIARDGHIVPLWPLKQNELPAWVSKQARKRGLEIDQQAIELLLWRTEGNLLATVMELDKLALAKPDSRWDAAKLSEYVADSARFDVFKLIDESIYGNAAKMRRVLRALKAEGEAPARLVFWIARQIQLMHELSLQVAQGGPVDSWLKMRQVYPPRTAAYQRAAGRHTSEQWEQLWIDVGDLDRLSKGRGLGSPWVALERLLLRVALSDQDGKRFAA